MRVSGLRVSPQTNCPCKDVHKDIRKNASLKTAGFSGVQAGGTS